MIGNGVVVSPEALFRELDALTARDVPMGRLVVSANAHVIASYHSTIDKVTERFLGKNKIGTTGRGIGPAYADKINRVGIRIADLFDEEILREKVEAALEVKNHLLTKVYNRRAITVDEVVEDLLRLRRPAPSRWSPTPRCCSTGRSTTDKTVLFEGAQATMLDVDHGTYPFVTSSNPVAGGVCTGAGVGPTRIDRVIGVIKAYTTRVGSGPFPTELFDEDGEKLWRDRRRGRRLDRARPPLRLVRRRRRPLRGAGQRAHRVLHDQARRALQLGADPGLRGLRRRRRPPRRDADDPDGVPPAPRRSTSSSTAGPRTSPAAGLRRPAEERPALRAGARGDVGRAVLGRRGRPRSRADRRRQLTAATVCVSRTARRPPGRSVRENDVDARSRA